MVDVPGLIEGAHQGAGLGDRFLRHVERTRVLVHLIDGTKPLDDVLTDKTTIENELRAWNTALLDRPIIVVITKIDCPRRAKRSPRCAIASPACARSRPRRTKACAS